MNALEIPVNEKKKFCLWNNRPFKDYWILYNPVKIIGRVLKRSMLNFMLPETCVSHTAYGRAETGPLGTQVRSPCYVNKGKKAFLISTAKVRGVCVESNEHQPPPSLSTKI